MAWRAARLASVDGVEGPGRGTGSRRGLLAVVDRLVVAQAVEAGVHPPAYVTDGLARRPHVNVLNVPFEPRQRRQALVTRLASVIFLGGAGATWHTTQAVSPVLSSERIFNALALIVASLFVFVISESTATPLYIVDEAVVASLLLRMKRLVTGKLFACLCHVSCA